MAVKVSPDDVIAFRLHSQHLNERAGGRRLLEVAGSCGIQNSPPGSALLALRARVLNLTQTRLDEAVGTDKTLLQNWAMRGAPFSSRPLTPLSLPLACSRRPRRACGSSSSA